MIMVLRKVTLLSWQLSTNSLEDPTRIKRQQVLLKLWYVSNIFQGITSWKTTTLIHTAMGNLNLIKLTYSYAEKQE